MDHGFLSIPASDLLMTIVLREHYESDASLTGPMELSQMDDVLQTLMQQSPMDDFKFVNLRYMPLFNRMILIGLMLIINVRYTLRLVGLAKQHWSGSFCNG